MFLYTPYGVSEAFFEYLPDCKPKETSPSTPTAPTPTPTDPINYTPPQATEPAPVHGFEPVEQSIDKVYYYHSDHLGSSSYVTDSNGRPIAYYDYLPFGEVAVEHNQTTNFNNGYKFNAKELDEATGMYYYGARYYDPRISVFVSVDPLAEKYRNIGGYVYTANNPINFIDPDGREPVPLIYSLYPNFKLKPTQWYMYTDGIYHSKSFHSAAIYSTKYLRSDAYQTVYQRNTYYGWVQEQIDAKGYSSKWFGAAELVTRFRGIGGTELPNLWFIKDNTEAFLKGGNKYLFSHNMKNAKELLENGNLSGSFIDANGNKQSFHGLSGMDLDFKMVEFEQSKVQEYINSFRGYDLSEIMNDINGMMNGSLPSSEVKKVIKNHFNGKFDFNSYEDRVKLGQELIRQSYEN